MSKKLIYQFVSVNSIDWHNYGAYISISEIEEDIKNLKAAGVTHIDSELHQELGDFGIRFRTYICREKTDKDIELENQRLIDRKNRKIRLLEAELNQLKQL